MQGTAWAGLLTTTTNISPFSQKPAPSRSLMLLISFGPSLLINFIKFHHYFGTIFAIILGWVEVIFVFEFKSSYLKTWWCTLWGKGGQKGTPLPRKWDYRLLKPFGLQSASIRNLNACSIIIHFMYIIIIIIMGRIPKTEWGQSVQHCW